MTNLAGGVPFATRDFVRAYWYDGAYDPIHPNAAGQRSYHEALAEVPGFGELPNGLRRDLPLSGHKGQQYCDNSCRLVVIGNDVRPAVQPALPLGPCPPHHVRQLVRILAVVVPDTGEETGREDLSADIEEHGPVYQGHRLGDVARHSEQHDWFTPDKIEERSDPGNVHRPRLCHPIDLRIVGDWTACGPLATMREPVVKINDLGGAGGRQHGRQRRLPGTSQTGDQQATTSGHASSVGSDIEGPVRFSVRASREGQFRR